MKHTIDTKAIQELAAMSPEVKVYLEREFPEAFQEVVFIISNSESCILKLKKESFNMSDLNNAESIAKNIIGWSGDFNFDFQYYDFRLATTEEIQRFITDYKPE